MHSIFNSYFKTTILTFIFCLFQILIAKENFHQQHYKQIHIVYTTNLNGQFTDCDCGGNIVGGFTRVSTVIESLISTYFPNTVLLDGGDFFSSYPSVVANNIMLQLISMAKYDAQNIGDQEFVEGEKFIFNVNRKYTAMLPFLSINLSFSDNSISIKPIKYLLVNNTKIAIIGFTHPEAFDFIKIPDSSFDGIEKLKDLQSEIMSNSDVQILLFHGSWESATSLVTKNPWLDVVILSHSHLKKSLRVGNSLLYESGANGEYVGHLILEIENQEIDFRNKYIPVTLNIEENETIKNIVDKYYNNLKSEKQSN